VIGSALVQHDLDARPLFPRYEVPLLNMSCFESAPDAVDALRQCAMAFLQDDLETFVTPEDRLALGVAAPRVHVGLIATGDQFINDEVDVQVLRDGLTRTLCVEMEGAATAQVCHEFGIPFVVFRTISDRADGAATVDFVKFLNSVAKVYSAGILRLFLRTLSSRDALQIQL